MGTPLRNALVLAASRGLGRGCAEHLAAAGLHTVLCGRDADRLHQAVEALRAEGGRVEGLTADVARAEDLERLASDLRERDLEPDVLVLNAGGPPAGGFFDLDEQQWRGAIELTLMSVVRTVRLFVPGMRERGVGRVVLIGSSSVRRPISGLTLSNVLRPGLAGLVKDLAVELAPHGVTVNMVSPGRIDTERVRELDAITAGRKGSSPEQVRESSEKAIPMGRYGDPGEFGAVVAFLASEQASYVTGQSLLVDGGLTCSLP